MNEHLGNIYQSGKLHWDPTIRQYRIVRFEGRREVSQEIEHYSLRGTQFRQWAMSRLAEYLVKSSIPDDERPNNFFENSELNEKAVGRDFRHTTVDGRTRIQCRFEGELDKAATVKSYLIVWAEGGRKIIRTQKHHNPPVILAFSGQL